MERINARTVMSNRRNVLGESGYNLVLLPSGHDYLSLSNRNRVYVKSRMAVTSFKPDSRKKWLLPAI